MKYMFYALLWVRFGILLLYLKDDLPIPDQFFTEYMLILIGIAITDKE